MWGVVPVRASCFLFLMALVVGCSSQNKYAPVKGQVLVKGEPGAKIRIEFHPNPAKGTKGPSSVADTDSEGRFTLFYATSDATGEGAIIGWHKVVLQDMRLAESETGRGVPIRFSADHGAVLTTPLEAEVKAGEQTIVIEVPTK